jgi:predicted nucleic acid-binding protein
VSERQWVLNASPLILLGKVGHIGLLEALCIKMVIPPDVLDTALSLAGEKEP